MGRPGTTESTNHGNDDPKTRDFKKTLAQARKQLKKGAKSTRGREPGNRRGSDSSQGSSRGNF